MDLSPLIQGNDSVQQMVASERLLTKQAIHLVAPQARDAIEQEIVPQIQPLVSSVEVLNELTVDLQNQIRHGFKVKNQTYTRLIRYKSIDQSDQQYVQDLLESLGDWADKTRTLLLGGGEPGKEAPQEVKVTVDTTTHNSVSVTTNSEGTQVTKSTNSGTSTTEGTPFDLNDLKF